MNPKNPVRLPSLWLSLSLTTPPPGVGPLVLVSHVQTIFPFYLAGAGLVSSGSTHIVTAVPARLGRGGRGQGRRETRGEGEGCVQVQGSWPPQKRKQNVSLSPPPCMAPGTACGISVALRWPGGRKHNGLLA